eukprot:SAG31_NODE_14319_length_814_cov_1.174825_1_plen_98_part_01
MQAKLHIFNRAGLSDTFLIITGKSDVPLSARATMIFILKMAAQLEQGQATRAISAVLLLLMMLRLVKSCQYHPKLYFITRTVELAASQLLPFMVNATF